MSIAPKISFSI